MSVSSLLSRGAVDILEELQMLTAKTMEKVEITKQYEVIRELGKGTYGRVDLVIHKARDCDFSSLLQYELATGRFPYPKWNSVFDQLTQVVKGDPPQLCNSDEREFSPSFINFVNLCLTKDESKRPKYRELLKHPFIVMYEERYVDVAAYVSKILDQMPATPSSPMYVD